MTFSYIVLLIAWTVLLIITVLQQRTIKHQSKTNDYLLDDIATLENKNDLLNIELEVEQNKLETEKRTTDRLASRCSDLHDRVYELEILLKQLDPDGYVIDFHDGLKPYASTVKEVVDRHVK